MDEFSFKIEKNLGTVAEGKGGWNLELNLVSWGGRPAKYDLRSWSPDHQKNFSNWGIFDRAHASVRINLPSLCCPLVCLLMAGAADQL